MVRQRLKLNGELARGQSTVERRCARPAGPDRELHEHSRWNGDVAVQPPQEVEAIDATQGDEGPGIGDDGRHDATPTSSSSSSGG